MKNYYEILEVSSKASLEVIEKAYRTLAKKYHPDGGKNSNIEEKRIKEKKMQEINEAYAVLSSEFLREQYDKEMQRVESDRSDNGKSFFETKKSKNKSDETEIKKFSETTTSENLYSICKNIFSNRPSLKSLKPKTQKDYLSIGLTIIIMIIFLILLWVIPFTRPFITSIIDIF